VALSRSLDASDGWRRDPSAPQGKSVSIEVDGESVRAIEGESLSVALAVNGRLVLRRSPGLNQPRGMFCLMGVCQECLVQVDGETMPSCMEPVREGMRVVLQPFERANPPKDRP
jgi:predicted molibdopterin-dependent oxidoreductase YjgC